MSKFQFVVGCRVEVVGNGITRPLVTVVDPHGERISFNIALDHPGSFSEELVVNEYDKVLFQSLYREFGGKLSPLRCCELLVTLMMADEFTLYDEEEWDEDQGDFPIVSLGDGSMLSAPPRIGPCRAITRSKKGFTDLFCFSVDEDYLRVFWPIELILFDQGKPVNDGIIPYLTRRENVIFLHDRFRKRE